jgi:hypothetical protein
MFQMGFLSQTVQVIFIWMCKVVVIYVSNKPPYVIAASDGSG